MNLRWTLLIVVSVVFAVSCGDVTERACLVGRWEAKKLDLAEFPIAGGPWYLIESVYEFREDATFATRGTYRRKGVVEEYANSGTYSVSENELSLLFEGLNKQMTASFQCRDSVLAILDHQTGAQIDMNRLSG